MRWMSPREYARLQGIDELPPTCSTRNELLLGFGDAVCVPVIHWIDRHLLTPLFESVAAGRKRRIGHARQSYA